ncbi:MAG: UvrD-helicase domain-containing protein [Bryobacteraceae bacterium]
MPRIRKPAPDQAQRDAAVAERDRNVLVDAGAGTGKTTILVDRLVEMLAPSRGQRAVAISRIAAITFTRKAAGDLRLRIRERLLNELAEVDPAAEREAQLRDALAGLDTAFVGTIHSFADRLLRLRPVEADLSPSYEIAEDQGPLIRETLEVLLQTVESGTLAAELTGATAATRSEEATQTILDALAAGLQVESRETEWKIYYGLDALVEGFIRQRDIPPPDVTPVPLDFPAFRVAADEFVHLASSLRGDSLGVDWIVRTASLLRRLRASDEPVAVYREVKLQLDRAPRNSVTKRDTFAGDATAWRVWKIFIGDDKQRPGALRDDLCAPLDRWMATRLVRLFPIVVAIYEKVKARRRQLDQLDLLLKLRDLLVTDRAVRGEFQQMFDHILVDEFQDTDPLQAEVVLFLCEREPRADRWDEIVLGSGKLTLVGDPKQSIYRFRRADVAMYDRVRGLLERGDPLKVKLSANFRSVPPLIDWLNGRFARVLGLPSNGRPFDPTTGRVFHQPIAAGREGDAIPPVHILPFDFGDGDKHSVDEYRELEGRVLARYLRWLVEASDIRIVDPLDGRPRPVRYSDVAILAVSTWRLSLLFPWLAAEGIPYASRGGTLFLEDPLHRQFLLGLRAIADRDDGVAEAALLRPPFFAVDLADLLNERASTKDGTNLADDSVLRARQARDLVRELRQRRFDRPPGTTARDLLERTAFARSIALGENGTQRLTRLRELCLVMEQFAAEEGLDYDAATVRLREWVERPIQLDPPHPVGTEAIQVITVHQAKGLEFPVVAIWDGKGQWDTRPESGAWRMERDGRGWMMDLSRLTWEEPAGLAIRQTERAYLDAERRRVVYVAATRARDLFVVPKAGDVPAGRFVCGDLLAEAPAHLIREIGQYIDGKECDWAREVVPRVVLEHADGAQVERCVTEWWTAASIAAVRPRFRPASVSGTSRAAPVAESENVVDAADSKPRQGRFGGLFGSVVHRAIGLILRDGAMPAPDAVRHATERFGLENHCDEAVADVVRALETLQAEGLAGPISPHLQVEYPVASTWEGGQLLVGYIDLIGATEGILRVIDFKTDAPPPGPVELTYPEYAAQVRAYGSLLAATSLLGDRTLRCGILFTADGGIRWIEPKGERQFVSATGSP